MEEDTIAVILCPRDKADSKRMAEMIRTVTIPVIHGRRAKVEVICAFGQSVADACNAGMQRSKARYKCYITSEVTVLAAELLMMFLKIFENHPRTGMVGCYGRWMATTAGRAIATDACAGARRTAASLMTAATRASGCSACTPSTAPSS